MKKVLKIFLTLSLSSMIITNSMIIAQEEETAADDEVTTEEILQEEEPVIETPETSELTEELLTAITEANNFSESKRISGFLDLQFTDGTVAASLAQIDYGLAHNSEEPLSAELYFLNSNPEAEEAFEFFAYIYQNYIFEAREDQWIVDSAESLEPFFTELLLNAEEPEVDLIGKYFDYYESELGYHLVLKENIDAQELWTDLNAVYKLETVRDNLIALSAGVQAEVAGVEIDENLASVLNTLVSVDKLAEILESNPTFELLYDAESYKLVNNFITLNINVEDIYAILGTEGEIPTTMRVISENFFSQHGEIFDFSFLDEVVPE